MLSRISNMLSSGERSHGNTSAKCGDKEVSDSDILTSEPNTMTGEKVNNSLSIIAKISNLYNDSTMSDITLKVGSKHYPAHRLILCNSSEVFQVMLMNPIWSESRESDIILQETAECEAVFQDFLKYLYTGMIYISHDSVVPIMSLADKYNVKDLIKVCVDYMWKHIVSAARQNQLIAWYQYSLACGHTRIAKECEDFIKWNFELIASMESFHDIELEVLVHFLQDSDLVVTEELSLYQCVVLWLTHQEERLGQEMQSGADVQLEQFVIEVMRYIRFPMMTPRQLAELLLSPLTKKFKEFFVEKLAMGMSYHSGQKSRVHDIMNTETSGQLMFVPRLYTAAKWCASLRMENFQSLPIYHTHTLLFSTWSSCADLDGESHLEWEVNFYPKGVWFRKCYLIVWQGMIDVPEVVMKTVRLSVISKEDQEVNVRVGVLVSGMRDGVEHVMSVITKKFIFTNDERVLNFEDFLSFTDLVSPKPNSPFLLGTSRDVMKVRIVITPDRDTCINNWSD